MIQFLWNTSNIKANLISSLEWNGNYCKATAKCDTILIQHGGIVDILDQNRKLTKNQLRECTLAMDSPLSTSLLFILQKENILLLQDKFGLGHILIIVISN